MFNFLNIGNFFVLLNKVSKSIKIIFVPVIIISLVFALYLSPKDYIQGDTVRIMYVHVPSAWLASILYFSLAISSAV